MIFVGCLGIDVVAADNHADSSELILEWFSTLGLSISNNYFSNALLGDWERLVYISSNGQAIQYVKCFCKIGEAMGDVNIQFSK